MHMFTAVSAASKPMASKDQAMMDAGGGPSLGLLFSSLLAKTAETPEMPANSPQLGSDMEELTGLLQFLKSETASEAGISQSVIVDLVLNGAEVQDHPAILELVSGDGAKVPVEETLETLLDLLNISFGDSNPSMSSAQLLNQIQAALPKLEEAAKGGNMALLSRTDAQTVIRLAKVLTLMQGDLNLPETAIERIGNLKDTLNRLAANIEETLKPSMKAAVRFEGMMARAQSHAQMYSHITHKPAAINQGNTTKIIPPAQASGNDLKASGNEFHGNSNPLLLMSKTEQYVMTLPDKQQARSGQFMKEFEALMGKAKFTNINGVQKLLVKLNPDHLGSLRIELIQKDGAMVARIIASTAQAKTLLDSHTKGMKEAFVNQSITVERLEITQTAPAFTQERNLHKDSEQRQQGNPGNQQQEETDGFMEQLEDAKSQMEEAEV